MQNAAVQLASPRTAPGLVTRLVSCSSQPRCRGQKLLAEPRPRSQGLCQRVRAQLGPEALRVPAADARVQQFRDGDLCSAVRCGVFG